MDRDGDTRKIGTKKHRHKIDNAPKTSSGLPECPARLKGLAREQWDRWSSQLDEMGMGRAPDAPMLEGACVAYARAVQADSIIDREGMMDKVYGIIKSIDKAGNPKQKRVLLKQKPHPAIVISSNAWKQARSFCTEFGLTLASSTRMPGEKKGDDLADIKKVISAPRDSRPPLNPLSPIKPIVQ